MLYRLEARSLVRTINPCRKARPFRKVASVSGKIPGWKESLLPASECCEGDKTPCYQKGPVIPRADPHSSGRIG